MALMVVGSIYAISESDLKKIMPNIPSSKVSSYTGYLNQAMASGSIDTCCVQAGKYAYLPLE